MSPAESATRAIEWLQGLLGDLSNLRNATSRDQSFKNWRQNTLTIMQRIWPGDQDKAERFRRIPFSPVDPRADLRAQRESFSRGCQEATRVLNSFVEEVVAVGVPAMVGDDPRENDASAFEDDFPTVDLPSGDLGSSYAYGVADENMHPEPELPGADTSYLPPAVLRVDVPTNAPPSSSHPASVPVDARPQRKGLGVAAKLRDLLGLGGYSAKSQQTPSGQFRAPQPPPPSLDILPVGDEVGSAPPRMEPVPRQMPWPTPQHAMPAEPSEPAAEIPPDEPPVRATPNIDAGRSVTMSKPTTLRTSIEKVSIESLISPEFRSGTESAPPEVADTPLQEAPPEPELGSGTPVASVPPRPIRPVPRPGTPATPPVQAKQPAKPAAPGKRAARPAPGAERPPLSIVPPLSSDPEFNVDPSPAPKAPPASSPARAGGPSKVVPLPLPPAARKSQPPPEEPAEETEDASMSNVDPEEFARATEDFMRSSPVLGATGRKLKRPANEPAAEVMFTDPDAIAVASMTDELTQFGVPLTRQSETRARLVDLARRIENAELEWNALRKAVWFAMEYPEVARRLMPLLLPWIDRAA